MAGEDNSQLYTPAHHSGQMDQRLNSTDYIHPQETNLLNLVKAMQYNTDGQPEIRVTNSLTLTSAPWNLQVARGLVTGVTGLSISGYNLSVGTTYIPLWHNNTTYTYLNTATQLTVWSDSASDTNVSVLISGLDADYLPITETVVLTNGVTGVLTTKSFFRVNNMSLTRVPMNVGVIHCGNNGKTTVLCAIEAGAGRSQQTIYTVPAGYTFYLTQSNWYTNNTGNNTGLYRSWTQSSTGVINVVLVFPFPVNYNSLKVVPRPYTEKTDIQWQVSSASGSAAVGGQIEGYLIKNII